MTACIITKDTNGSDHIYHTQSDCDNLPERTREVSVKRAEARGFTECKICKRGWQPHKRDGASLGQQIQRGDIELDL